jgi:hypothetical protein
MNRFHNLALSLLTSEAQTYATSEPTAEELIAASGSVTRLKVAKSPKKLSKLALVKLAKLAADEAKATPRVIPSWVELSEPLPEKGTISARQYLKACVNAGVKVVKVNELDEKSNTFVTKIVERTHKNLKREEEIRAIAAYIGYNVELSHGANLMLADDTAEKEVQDSIRPGRRAVFSGHSSMSLAGFIMGMPNDRQKKLDNLMARRRLSVDALAEADGVACAAYTQEPAFIDEEDHSKGTFLCACCCERHARTEIESHRIAQIDRDLSELMGN